MFAVSPEADVVLADMDSVNTSFISDLCQAKGYVADPPIQSLKHMVDAQETSWGESVSSLAASVETCTLKVTTRSTSSAATQAKEAVMAGRVSPSKKEEHPKLELLQNDPKWATITVPTSPAKTHFGKEGISRSFLQRAWAHSTEHDTTYTIFNCGNFERIGFRHRASRTFFLSELINVPDSKDPHYGKIQMGLYLAILQDALDRLKKQEGVNAPSNAPNNKRRRIHALPSNKRPRTRASSLKEKAQAENKRIATEAARMLPLALLVFRYGIYNSPAPASFLRLNCTRKGTYTASEYIKVVVTSKIAAGATGTVHGADVEVMDGTTVRRLNAVVKLAFGAQERDRMRH
ncbi:hypothetical protein H0H87_010958, partial [Tephrocybe sp. NHM501043]